jgi:hypothetical protein
MILTYSENSVQLAYTPDEYEEFQRAIAAFKQVINDTLRKEISNLPGDIRKDYRGLIHEFKQSLEYIEHSVIVTRSNAGMQLTLDTGEFDKFDNNIGILRIFLSDFQDWYHDRGEYEKRDALENAQDLIDMFMVLLGGKRIDAVSPGSEEGANSIMAGSSGKHDPWSGHP